LDFTSQLTSRKHKVDETDGACLLYIEKCSFIQKSDCSGAAEQTCEHLRGANARQKTDIDLGLAEAS
jgi:hypothetical protein